MKSIILFLLIIFSSVISYGQEDLYVWKAGLWTGITAQQNEFVLPANFSEPAYGIEFSRNLSHTFSLNTGFGTNVESANMVFSSLNFRLNNGWLMKERSKLSPFLGAGASYIGLNDINTDHFNIFTEVGLKLKINDRFSTGLSYVVFIPESKFNINTLPQKDLSQAVKLAVSFHFGDKAKSYKAPQFYSTTLMNTPTPVDKNMDVVLSDSIAVTLKKDSGKVQIPETRTNTKQTNNLKDSAQAISLPDSLYLLEDTLNNNLPVADSLLSIELSPSNRMQEIPKDSSQKISVSEPLIIKYDSLLQKSAKPDSLINETADDSIINMADADLSNLILPLDPLKTDKTGDVYIYLNDSTITLKMDQDKSLIIKFQPQYIIPAANPSETRTALAEEVPATTYDIPTTNQIATLEDLPLSTPFSTQETSTSALTYDNQPSPTNIGLLSLDSPSEKFALADSSELFYIKEQNKLLIDILKHLTGVNKPEETLRDTSLNTSKEEKPMTKVIPPIKSEDSILAPVENINYEEWNAKVVSLELNIELLNEKLIAISEKLALRDSLEKSVPKAVEKQIFTPEPEQLSTFRVEYPANIFYEINETSVHPEYKKLLENVSLDQIENPEFKLMLSGFTDKSGNSEYNKLLSLKRAELLKAELISLGVKEGNIYVIGFGEKNAGENTSSKLERRTELRLIKILQ